MGISACRLSLSRKGLQERNKLILSSCLEVYSCCKAITCADDHVSHVSTYATSIDVLQVVRCLVQREVPTVICMGGGYSRPIEPTVDAHYDVYRMAAQALAGEL